MDAVKKIYQTEGIMAFTKGFEACAWRHGLWNVGYFSVIKTVRESLPPSDVHTHKHTYDCCNSCLDEKRKDGVCVYCRFLSFSRLFALHDFYL